MSSYLFENSSDIEIKVKKCSSEFDAMACIKKSNIFWIDNFQVTQHLTWFKFASERVCPERVCTCAIDNDVVPSAFSLITTCCGWLVVTTCPPSNWFCACVTVTIVCPCPDVDASPTCSTISCFICAITKNLCEVRFYRFTALSYLFCSSLVLVSWNDEVPSDVSNSVIAELLLNK